MSTSEVSLDPFTQPPEPVKRWTVAEYHELIKLGVLHEGDPYELIEGWLVTKMTKNPPHESATNFLSEWLIRSLPGGWSCRTQSAITLSDGEPEPDLAVVTGSHSRYRQRHPGRQEVALVMEVADATLPRDRGVKLRSYARAGIPEYWIVNLVRRQIEIYSRPLLKQKQHGYGQRQVYGKGKSVPLVIDGQEYGRLAVEDVC